MFFLVKRGRTTHHFSGKNHANSKVQNIEQTQCIAPLRDAVDYMCISYGCALVSKGTIIFEITATQIKTENNRSRKSTGKFWKKHITSAYHSITYIS